MKFRHAKIVCTLGPACDSLPMILRLMRAGMDVARLNFSHGNHERHAALIARLREASMKLQKPIALVADLQGPKIRTGTLVDGKRVQLRSGQRFTISTDGAAGSSAGVSTTYRRLPREVKRGDRILLADGLIELRVKSAGQTSIVCDVVNGGELGEHKGINLPGVHLNVPALTPKDHEDLIFALAHSANYIAVSFIRRGDDVRKVRAAIARAGYKIPIIVKLEKPEAIENLDEILTLTDGVMVARGDLGVEMSPERVPVVQKHVIARARDARRPVITATQMLESMIASPRPTRAEAADVANAIIDGTDAVMLSGETARGAYPIEAVRVMATIARQVETNYPHEVLRYRRVSTAAPSIETSIAEGAAAMAEELNLRFIVTGTTTGNTARAISSFRPRANIVAMTPIPAVARRMALVWGVEALVVEPYKYFETLIDIVEARMLRENLAESSEIIVITSGMPVGEGGTNVLKIHALP